MPQPMSPYYWWMMQQQLGQNMPPPDIPPVAGGGEPTTAPFGPPGQGGPGSYPAASPSPTPDYGNIQQGAPSTTATGAGGPSAYVQPPPGFYGQFEQAGTPWTGEPGVLPSPTTTDTTGAGLASEGLSWYPLGDGQTYGQFDQNGNLVATLPASNIPYGGTQATTQMMSPVQASSGMMGFPPATPAGGVDLGGWGQPAGYFGVPGQGAIGAFGVGGGGGTLAGGSNIGAGPLPGTPSEFGGGGGQPLGSTMGGIAGLHSPGFQQALASGMVLPGWQSSGTTAGDYTGRGVKGAA